MIKRWHVVSWYDTMNDWREEDWPLRPEKEERVWTISLDPAKTGWENDCDCPRYGLTWFEAAELANAANLCHEMDWREPTKYMLDTAAEAFFHELPHAQGMAKARRVFSTMFESYLREKGIDA